MKIRINAGGKRFHIAIPTDLIFSKPSVWLYMKIARKCTAIGKRYMHEDVDVSVNDILDNIPEEAVYALCQELRRIKRKHGSWQLLEVESADGSVVNIAL